MIRLRLARKAEFAVLEHVDARGDIHRLNWNVGKVHAPASRDVNDIKIR